MTEPGHSGGSTPPPAPRVFISYAHESDEHQEAVRDLWVLLRTFGIDARLDLPAAGRRQDWPLWMLRQVRSADYVLIIASREYQRRAEGLADPDEGRGVQHEAALIREEIYRDREKALVKFLPVVLPGHTAEEIPEFLGPVTSTSYALEQTARPDIDPLLRVLTNQPLEVAPPLGTIPHLPPRGHGAPAKPTSPFSALAHELVLEVTYANERIEARAILAGTVLGESSGRLPFGLDRVWDSLTGPADKAEERLAQVGHSLRSVLFADATVDRLLALLDESPIGTVLELIIDADGPAFGLPYELLRLPDERVLATVPGVRMRRRLRGIDREPSPPLPGPLKILVAVGAPEETRTANPPLDIEAEMQAILDAVSVVEARSEAQVTILEVGSPDQIAEALRDNQHHVLHLSAHGSAQGLELEDEDGNPVPLEAAELVQLLRGAGRPLPLIVLSSCAGAAGGSDALAATLIAKGADRVVAMQASVTDVYATRLARLFYGTLSGTQGATVAHALAEARRHLEAERLGARRSSGTTVLPEYGLATLMGVGADPPLVDHAASPVPLANPTVAPAGTGVREMRIGDLIGRRPQLRDTLMALRGGDEARDRWGALSGVVLTGVGGIGKTALAGRAMARLGGEGWVTAVHEGAWNPPALTSAVVAALRSSPLVEADTNLEEALSALTRDEADDTQNLDAISTALERSRLLLLFDDFEQNLEDDRFRDAGFEEAFERLYNAAVVGRVFVTCRYPVPGSDVLLLRIPVPPLSASELRRLLLRLPALRELDLSDRRVLTRTVGGHPRLIEFIDALLRGGRSNLRELTRKLRSLADEHGINLSERRSFEEAVPEAVRLATRDILLNELLDRLNDEEREVLSQAAVSRVAFSTDDLVAARWGVGATDQQRRDVFRISQRLVDLTLLSPAGDSDLVVQPWMAEGLPAESDESQMAERHERAIAMRFQRLEDGRADFGDLAEIARHLAALGQSQDLVSFGLDTAEALGAAVGEQSVAAFLGEVVPMVRPDTPGFLPLADREALALLSTGSTSAALQRSTELLRITEERARRHADDPMAQREHSVSLGRQGALRLRLGKSAEAEQFYREALEIRERLSEADPTSTEAQRDLSVTYTNLADVALGRGGSEEAERLYRAALEIRERLAKADPTSTEAQRDLSVTYTNLADVALGRGDSAEAERLYRAALEIRERLSEADPKSGEARRDLSVAYTNLASVARRRGDSAETERLYRAALAIDVELVEADPTSAHAKRDLSVTYMNLANLARGRGDSPEAERLYGAALAIGEQLAEADPTSAQAQRDLSIAYTNLANLAQGRGDTVEAERLYRAALAIDSQLGEADPTSTQTQRDISITYNNLADLALARGDRDEAERLYRAALEIRERLTAADPTSAQAQRDLSITYNYLANLALARGDSDEAERLYRAAFEIRERLAEADPTSAQAQRDLSVAYTNLGDLAGRLGDLEEAERRSRASLAIDTKLAEADPSSAEAQRDLSVSYNNLANLSLGRGENDEAERLYRAALAIAQQLATVDPTSAQAQRDVSLTYGNLASLALGRDDYDEADRLYRAALAIDTRLAEGDPANAQAQLDLSITYNNLANLAAMRDDPAEAERLYRAALVSAEAGGGLGASVADAVREALRRLEERGA